MASRKGFESVVEVVSKAIPKVNQTRNMLGKKESIRFGPTSLKQQEYKETEEYLKQPEGMLYSISERGVDSEARNAAAKK